MAEEIKEIDDYSYYLGEGGVLEIRAKDGNEERVVAEISCGDKLDGECNDLALTVLQEMGYKFRNGKKEK